MSNYHVQTLKRPVVWSGWGHPVKGLLATVTTWQQRYELRRHLLELDDRLLDDMGLSTVQARQEAAKPFWRD
ncbi:MAG: DUF1127 domain-containing protein [Proteobacteria bacterium]|nr:DUF1127 domain-containing protein [Pseudomonadota bacterium]